MQKGNTEIRALLLRHGFLARLGDAVWAGELSKESAMAQAVRFYEFSDLAHGLSEAEMLKEVELLRSAIDYDPPQAALDQLLRSIVSNSTLRSR